MTRLARLPLAAGVLLFALACHSDSLTPPTGGPLAAFSDGAHAGNPDFFFLPPLFKSPSSNRNFEPGAFNPNVKPVVEICELDGGTCVDGLPLRRFETAELRLTDQHYQVNWRTDESNLTLTSYYRITVIVGTDTLGFADVDPVGTGRELRSVETGEYIGLVDGRTLPIRFRIENGALCDGSGPCTSRTIALNAPGGNVIVLEGTGDQVRIPQQASGQVVTVTLQLCNDGEGNLTSIDVDLRRFGNCVRVTTDPILEQALSPKARVDICSLIGEVPDLPGEQEHLITLHRQDDEVVRALPHAYGNDCSGLSSAPVPGLRGLAVAGWRWVRRNVAALVTPRPLHARAMLLDVGELGGLTDGFSDFQLALPAMMEALGGEGQACDVETPPDDRPGVCVTDAHGDPVDGDTVHFEVFEGDGAVTPMEVVSGAGGVPGVAQVDEVTFGDATTVQVRAFGVGIAAQNNYPEGTVRPFMPAIDDDGEPLTAEQREAQVPVLLQTGEVVFSVTAVVAEGSWEGTGSSLAFGRRDHTATLLENGDVLIVGGTASGAFIYNLEPSSFTATEGAPVFSHGQHATATRLTDGRVLVVGGLGAPFGAEIYDPSNGSFTATQGGTTEGATNASRIAHSATLLPDGRVLLAGGQTQDGPSQTHAQAEIYDPATDAFTPVGSLDDHRSGHGAALLADGHVLIVGGTQTTDPGFGICLSSAELFDPETETFSSTGGMATGRCDLLWNNATVLAGGKVLVVGGPDETAELYDASAGTFAATGSLASRHTAGSSTLLADGRVLVAGGVTASGPVTSAAAEIYNPTSGVFTPASDMEVPRQQHTATRLLDGRVLVVGGFSSPAGADVGSAELFSLPPPIP